MFVLCQWFGQAQVVEVVFGERVVNRGHPESSSNGMSYCSGLMNPDTNVGGKVTTLIEVSDDQKTTFLYS